jgi:8-oxo-dGTP pyrophosphatase MutT (NUDIX family)
MVWSIEMKNKLYRAGLLPYIIEDGEIKFLFMKPADFRYGGDAFQIAKGKIEDGETGEAAAIREAEEELGLIRGNIDNPIFIGEYLGRTSIFIARVFEKTKFNHPHFETSETSWMTFDQFQVEGRNLHVTIVQTAARAAYLTTR